MKVRKGALTAIVAAGIAALPISAAAADSSAALPQGKAIGSAATVTVSLAPLHALAGSNIDDILGKVSDTYGQVCAALNKASGQSCPPLTIPKIPGSLQVAVAQSSASGSLVQDTSDVVGGASSSTPVSTDWDYLNTNIKALEDMVSTLVNSCLDDLTGGTLPPTCGQSSLPTGNLLTVKNFDIEGTVAAALHQTGAADTYYDSAQAVGITGGSQLNGVKVLVDPFTAAAVDKAHLSSVPSTISAPQVSASNALSEVDLPLDSVTGGSTPSLTSLISTVQGLDTTLLNAISAFQQGGLPSLSSALQNTPLAGLASTLQPVSDAASTVVAPLQSLAGELTGIIDDLKALNADLSGLPDTNNLVTIDQALSTAKLAQYAGGGVEALGTSTVGSIDVLPIGDTLAGLLKPQLQTLASDNVPGVNTDISGATPLLSVRGITSTADAFIRADGSGDQQGTGSLAQVSVLGQPIDVLGTLGVGASKSWVITIPTLGSVTLQITRGQPQIVSNYAQNREVRMATLDITLINGVACTADCIMVSPTVSAPSINNSARIVNAAAPASGGIQQLGDGTTPFIDMAIGDTTAAVSEGTGNPGSDSKCLPPDPLCTPPAQLSGHTTTLPSTGMFGGGALPAGLLLIAVAISLRLVPSLRFRLNRVR